jgi:hypothetical protein
MILVTVKVSTMVLGLLVAGGVAGIVIDRLVPREPTMQEREAMLKRFAGAYVVRSLKRGACDAETTSVPLSPGHGYVFQVVLGELIGVPCDSNVTCQAIVEGTKPFSYELGPALTLVGDAAAPDPDTLANSAVQVHMRDDGSVGGRLVASSTPTAGCERYVIDTRLSATPSGIEVHRTIERAHSRVTSNCEDLPTQCTSMELRLDRRI